MTVSKLATVEDVKLAVCEMVGGVVTPDHVVIVYVKDSAVECTLVRASSVSRSPAVFLSVYPLLLGGFTGCQTSQES